MDKVRSILRTLNTKAIKEALKELTRLAFFAVLSVIVGYVTTKLTSVDPTSMFYVIVTAILRFVDKWIHENEDISIKGLSPL